MRVCYFGTYESNYPRNEMMIEAMREVDITVFPCHENIWKGQRDKSGAHKGVALLVLVLRVVLAYVRLTVRYFFVPGHEVLMVGYIGQLDMMLAWVLAKVRGVVLVFNPMLSLSDTFCSDRTLVSPSSLAGRVLWLLDYLSCRAAEMVLMDTQQHTDYFVQTFGLSPETFRVVPVGADDRVFRAHPLEEKAAGVPCEVVFVGKYIPLHGTETIIRAAALLRDAPVHFTMIGSGQEFAAAQDLVRRLELDNITMLPWVDYQLIPHYYAQADICLGIFGDTPKAGRVVPNKVYQSMAMMRPVLTADTPALRAELRPGENVWVCQPANPADLAAQIQRLADDRALRYRLAEQGYETFQQRYTVLALGHRLQEYLNELVPGFARGDQMSWGDQPSFYGPRHYFREQFLFQAVRRYAPGRRVLDAACGAGTLVRRLSAHGYQAIGLDLSRDFLTHISSQQTTHSPDLLQSSIHEIPCASGSLDAVVAAEVLEHLQDDETPLREFWRVLRPGGICVISVPAEPEQWDWHDNWAGHVRRYRRRDLRKILMAQGYRVVQLHHFGFPFVRAFHRYVYLPRYRRKIRTHTGKLDQLSVSSSWQQAASSLLYGAFQFDHLFNRLPLGIGLIAVAKKPDL